MHFPYLVGEKVYLRPLEKGDVPVLTAWFNDIEVTRSLLVYRPVTLRFEEEFVEKTGRDETQLIVGIAVKATDRLIGSTGLHPIDLRNRQTGFGIAIGDKAEWGKGYGTEATRLLVNHAFSMLNLHRVWLHVYEFNKRARRVYERLGFREEGTLRQDCFRDGRYWNTTVMGILADEWRMTP